MSKEKISEIIPEESVKTIQEILEQFESMESLEVKNQEQYDSAVGVCKEIKKSIKAIESDRKEIIKPWKEKTDAVNAKYREVRVKLENGEKKIKGAMSVFFEEQERKRLEEQRKIEAEAEEKRRKAEEAARKEAEKVAKYREEGREELAEKAEARMETKLDEATNTVVAEVESKKTEGVHYRTSYEVEVTDDAQAAVALLNNPMTAHCVSINTVALKKMITATQGNFKCAGIKVRETKTPVVKS